MRRDMALRACAVWSLLRHPFATWALRASNERLVSPPHHCAVATSDRSFRPY